MNPAPHNPLDPLAAFNMVNNAAKQSGNEKLAMILSATAAGMSIMMGGLVVYKELKRTIKEGSENQHKHNDKMVELLERIERKLSKQQPPKEWVR